MLAHLDIHSRYYGANGIEIERKKKGEKRKEKIDFSLSAKRDQKRGVNRLYIARTIYCLRFYVCLVPP